MGCLRAAILAASLLAATCDDEALWFFGADAEWTGPVGYLKNLMPDAEAVARAGTDARWSANASACGAPCGVASPPPPTRRRTACRHRT